MSEAVKEGFLYSNQQFIDWNIILLLVVNALMLNILVASDGRMLVYWTDNKH